MKAILLILFLLLPQAVYAIPDINPFPGGGDPGTVSSFSVQRTPSTMSFVLNYTIGDGADEKLVDGALNPSAGTWFTTNTTDPYFCSTNRTGFAENISISLLSAGGYANMNYTQSGIYNRIDIEQFLDNDFILAGFVGSCYGVKDRMTVISEGLFYPRFGPHPNISSSKIVMYAPYYNINVTESLRFSEGTFTIKINNTASADYIPQIQPQLVTDKQVPGETEGLNASAIARNNVTYTLKFDLPTTDTNSTNSTRWVCADDQSKNSYFAWVFSGVDFIRTAITGNTESISNPVAMGTDFKNLTNTTVVAGFLSLNKTDNFTKRRGDYRPDESNPSSFVPVVAVNNNTNEYLLAWAHVASGGVGHFIRGKVFYQNGTNKTTSFLVKDDTTGISDFHVTYTYDDRYVFVWDVATDIHGRAFHTNGTAATGVTSLVSQTNISTEPFVSALKGDEFLLSWMDNRNQTVNGKWVVFAQIFHTNLTNKTRELDVAAPTSDGLGGLNTPLTPRSAGQPNGDFVVVWQKDESDLGLDYNIKARLYYNNLTSKASEFRVDGDLLGNDQEKAWVAVHRNGDFVVSWEHDGAEPIFHRRYFENGTAKADQVSINTTGNEFDGSGVFSDPSDDDYLVVYANFSSISFSDHEFTLFYFNGTRKVEERKVNANMTVHATDLRPLGTAFLPNGDAVFAYVNATGGANVLISNIWGEEYFRNGYGISSTTTSGGAVARATLSAADWIPGGANITYQITRDNRTYFNITKGVELTLFGNETPDFTHDSGTQDTNNRTVALRALMVTNGTWSPELQSFALSTSFTAQNFQLNATVKNESAFLAASVGSCLTVANSRTEQSISTGSFLSRHLPAFSYPSPMGVPIRIFLRYAGLDFQNNVTWGDGSFRLIIQHNGTRGSILNITAQII